MVDKSFKTHKVWIYMLTIAWLIATFEHNAFTLSKFTHNVYYAGIPVSDISAILVVLALDLSIFWSVFFMPQAKRWDMPVGFVKSILVISTLVSIMLNIRYMVTAIPTDNIFDLITAVIIGTLIPTFVVIYGWLEGNIAIVEKDIMSEVITTAVDNVQSNKKFTDEELENALINNPGAKPTELAGILGVSRQTIHKRLNALKARRVYE